MNRLRANWSNDLLELIEQAPEHAAHDFTAVPVTLKSPALLGLLFEAREQIDSPLVSHWPPIIRIDQAKVPQLATLVDIGNSRAGYFQQSLRQAVAHAVVGQLVLPRQKIGQEFFVTEEPIQKAD